MDSLVIPTKHQFIQNALNGAKMRLRLIEMRKTMKVSQMAKFILERPSEFPTLHYLIPVYRNIGARYLPTISAYNAMTSIIAKKLGRKYPNVAYTWHTYEDGSIGFFNEGIYIFGNLKQSCKLVSVRNVTV